MIEVLLVIHTVWLILMTLAVLGLVRSAALERLAYIGGGSGGGPMVDLNNDGPEVGQIVPGPDLRALFGNDRSEEAALVLLVSASCGTCIDRLDGAVRRGAALDDRYVALVGGTPGSDTARSLTGFLERRGVRTISGPDASSLATRLQIHSTPFAVAIDAGRVVAKRYLETGLELIDLESEVRAVK